MKSCFSISSNALLIPQRKHKQWKLENAKFRKILNFQMKNPKISNKIEVYLKHWEFSKTETKTDGR